MLRIGMVGAGVIGDAHADAISRLDDQKVVAIAEPVDQAREALAAKYSVPKTYRDWRDGSLSTFEADHISTGMPNSMQAHFAECIRSGARPIVTAEDGLAAPRIVEAGYESGTR